ncbi:helix-turn-helix transcriptional regulator [Treponema primitia]|uniref:helix-turn-helix domain-containing protein n=1 Tax=Treponema primitia TaxID=88058 RepID=UPI0039806F59
MVHETLIAELREYIKKRYRLVSIPSIFKGTDKSLPPGTERGIRPNAFGEATELLASFVKQNQHEPFAFTLESLREEKGLKPAELYKRAWIDKRLYSKILTTGNYKPKKETAIAFGLALHLPITEFNGFLKTAGFTLSDSSISDLVIRFCIEHELWDIADVNALLFESGQKVLCRE